LVSAAYVNRHQKLIFKNKKYYQPRSTQKNTYFWYRLFKTTDTKNKILFLVTVEIISLHHKKILGATINYFSTSAWARLSLSLPQCTAYLSAPQFL
jgi:hypothetical protein